MDKDLNKYTLKELQELEEHDQDALFNSVVIVPTKTVHDSGYRCMKFVLCRDGAIVGVCGGYSDVVHPNGIGNYGKDFLNVMYGQRLVPHIGLSIDCLRRSKCVRLMLAGLYKSEDMILSDWIFYKK